MNFILKKIKIDIDDSGKLIILGDKEIIIHCRNIENNIGTSYFDIIKRTYTKKHNPLELEFMKFLIGYRARFVPQE